MDLQRNSPRCRAAQIARSGDIPEQIFRLLRDSELVIEAGVPMAEILRQHNISKATYFHWRSKYAGASVDELKRLRELEAENAKLKRMYAELALENAAIKDVLSRKR